MKAEWETALEREELAQRLTWEAWRRRDAGRLFKLGDLNWRPKRSYRRWNEAWGYKAVGVVPPLAHDHFLHRYVCVGIWLPITRGYLEGAEVRIQSLDGPSSTTHRDPTNVGFVHVLPEDPFQVIARRQFEDEASQWSRDHCVNCGYRWAEDEYPCEDCWRCAGCCDAIYGVKPCSESLPYSERQAAA